MIINASTMCYVFFFSNKSFFCTFALSCDFLFLLFDKKDINNCVSFYSGAQFFFVIYLDYYWNTNCTNSVCKQILF